LCEGRRFAAWQISKALRALMPMNPIHTEQALRFDGAQTRSTRGGFTFCREVIQFHERIAVLVCSRTVAIRETSHKLGARWCRMPQPMRPRLWRSGPPRNEKKGAATPLTRRLGPRRSPAYDLVIMERQMSARSFQIALLLYLPRSLFLGQVGRWPWRRLRVRRPHRGRHRQERSRGLP